MINFRKVIGILIIIFSICSCKCNVNQESKSAEDFLVIISPHWEGHRNESAWLFEKYHKNLTGRTVRIDWLDEGGTSNDIRYIRSAFEKNPNTTGIDLFYGGGLDPHLQLLELGCLEKCEISETIIERIPKDLNGVPLYDPEKRWFGAQLSSFGILYNKVVLDMLDLPQPKTWEDLAQPKLFSWVGSADPRSSGSAHMMYETILQAYGWELGWDIIIKMGGNCRGFTQSASKTTTDASFGEVAYAMAIDTYAWAQIEKVGKDKMGFVMPIGLSSINPDSISMLKGAPHPELAKEFIEFSLSSESQKMLMLPKGEVDGPQKYELLRMSILPDIYNIVENKTPITTNPFKIERTLTHDSQLGSNRWAIVNDLIGTMIIDLQKELSQAWKVIIDLDMPADLCKKLTKMPILEDEALNLAKNEWKDNVKRNAKLNEWSNFAKNKYKDILSIERKGKTNYGNQ